MMEGWTGPKDAKGVASQSSLLLNFSLIPDSHTCCLSVNSQKMHFYCFCFLVFLTVSPTAPCDTRSVAVLQQTRSHHCRLHSYHCSRGSCCIVKASCFISRSVPPRALHGKSLEFNASSKVTCDASSQVAGYCIAACVKR